MIDPPQWIGHGASIAYKMSKFGTRGFYPCLCFHRTLCTFVGSILARVFRFLVFPATIDWFSLQNIVLLLPRAISIFVPSFRQVEDPYGVVAYTLGHPRRLRNISNEATIVSLLSFLY